MKKVNENSLWFRILHTPSLVVGAVLLILDGRAAVFAACADQL